MMRAPVGVIHGRFQMLHNGHMEYLLAGKARCDYLVIGISNPDSSLVKFSEANPHRSAAGANPLTFQERFQMIKGAMLEAGVGREEFDIVPFPISKPEMIRYYIPDGTTVFVTILDPWGYAKTARLKDFGCRIYRTDIEGTIIFRR